MRIARLVILLLLISDAAARAYTLVGPIKLDVKKVRKNFELLHGFEGERWLMFREALKEEGVEWWWIGVRVAPEERLIIPQPGAFVFKNKKGDTVRDLGVLSPVSLEATDWTDSRERAVGLTYTSDIGHEKNDQPIRLLARVPSWKGGGDWSSVEADTTIVRREVR